MVFARDGTMKGMTLVGLEMTVRDDTGSCRACAVFRWWRQAVMAALPLGKRNLAQHVHRPEPFNRLHLGRVAHEQRAGKSQRIHGDSLNALL